MIPLLLFNAFDVLKMIGLYYYDSKTETEEFLTKEMFVQHIQLTLAFLIFTLRRKKDLANLGMTCVAIKLTGLFFASGEKVGSSMAATALLMAMDFLVFISLSLFGGGSYRSSDEVSRNTGPVAVHPMNTPVRGFVTFYSVFLVFVLFSRQLIGFDPSTTFSDLFSPTATITDTAELFWFTEGVIIIQSFMLYWSVWRHGTDEECEILSVVSIITLLSFLVLVQRFQHVLSDDHVRGGTNMPIGVAVLAIGAVIRHRFFGGKASLPVEKKAP